VQVAIERVSMIPRNERGKFRAVISKIRPAKQRVSRPEPVNW
jgi:hypothetical protein